eukprot:CAMPEP_0117419660 /NCGR_PEP_ID=MMETSP0758-20121206/1175_1 /TAXON_ID=63605 /ORGANISM="Percolomonas cosmopolitus, Strain AE-1 (ATCC 50343)" /LENGTH=1407 /DNA_ID=CAMNT_0005200853 /DNA_START=1377 /DNA_END=5600 /DNA_ORIENTATION=+
MDIEMHESKQNLKMRFAMGLIYNMMIQAEYTLRKSSIQEFRVLMKQYWNLPNVMGDMRGWQTKLLSLSMNNEGSQSLNTVIWDMVSQIIYAKMFEENRVLTDHSFQDLLSSLILFEERGKLQSVEVLEQVYNGILNRFVIDSLQKTFIKPNHLVFGEFVVSIYHYIFFYNEVIHTIVKSDSKKTEMQVKYIDCYNIIIKLLRVVEQIYLDQSTIEKWIQYPEIICALLSMLKYLKPVELEKVCEFSEKLTIILSKILPKYTPYIFDEGKMTLIGTQPKAPKSRKTHESNDYSLDQIVPCLIHVLYAIEDKDNLQNDSIDVIDSAVSRSKRKRSVINTTNTTESILTIQKYLIKTLLKVCQAHRYEKGKVTLFVLNMYRIGGQMIKQIFKETKLKYKKYLVQNLQEYNKEILGQQERTIYNYRVELEKKILSNVRRYRSDEISRFRNILRQFDERHARFSDLTSELIESISNDRSVWETNTEHQWTVDESETNLRQRFKMKPATFIVNHEKAAKEFQKTSVDTKVETFDMLSNKFKIPTLALVPRFQINKSTEADSSSTPSTPKSKPNTPSGSLQPSSFTRNEKEEKEKFIFRDCYCEFVAPMCAYSGIMDLTTLKLIFFRHDTNQCSINGLNDKTRPLYEKPPKVVYVKWESVQAIYKRRYALRNTAFELFMIDGGTIFFNFSTTSKRNQFYNKSVNCINKCLKGSRRVITSNSNELKRITSAWKKHEISNFDYIMRLNMLANRTYNDLSQYPVFPWVLKNYSSEKLDVANEENYRDLSKPMGALTEERLETVQERYEMLKNPETPSFHYGSHYSSPGIVLYFLIRMEPFTTLARILQGGFFDHPDRMFFDMQSTYNEASEGQDFKELIPEFYYNTEFLQIWNNLYLGKRQNGKKVDNVELPPWAEGSSQKFIYKMRQALESPYVSKNLHHWIDLIFGYKQQGPEAEKATNIFHYLTYEGTVNVDKIEDKRMKNAIISQIQNFGQTPSQLFYQPHVQRNEGMVVYRSLSYVVEQKPKGKYELFFPKSILQLQLYPSDCVVTHIQISLYDVVAITLPFAKMTHYSFNEAQRNQIFTHQEKKAHRTSMTYTNLKEDGQLVKSTNVCDIPYVFSSSITPSECFTAYPIQTTGYGYHQLSQSQIESSPKYEFLSCSHFRSTIHGFSYDPKTNFISNIDVISGEHINEILAICSDGSYMVTCSQDTSLRVYMLNAKNQLELKHVLTGHDSSVTNVGCSENMDMLVSGSSDGTLMIFQLYSGRYIRSIPIYYEADDERLPDSILLVRVSKCTGKIAVYTASNTLFLFTCNGDLLSKLSLNNQGIRKLSMMEIRQVRTFPLSNESIDEYLYYSGISDPKVHVRSMTDFSLRQSFPIHTENTSLTIQCCSFLDSSDFMAFGCSDGLVIVMEHTLM